MCLDSSTLINTSGQGDNNTRLIQHTPKDGRDGQKWLLETKDLEIRACYILASFFLQKR